jgi:ankyrin repeat protein
MRQYASANGHKEVVELLLKDRRVNPSVDNNFAIRRASYYGHKEIVEILLKDNRVDPSDMGNEAMWHAQWNSNYEIADLLLKDNRVKIPSLFLPKSNRKTNCSKQYK